MPVPAVPGAGFVVVEAKLVLGGLDDQRQPSTWTSLSAPVPAGHQVAKYVSLP